MGLASDKVGKKDWRKTAKTHATPPKGRPDAAEMMSERSCGISPLTVLMMMNGAREGRAAGLLFKAAFSSRGQRSME